MYQSRVYQATWKYDPGSTAVEDFNAHVGRVLSKGVYQQSGNFHATGSGATSKAVYGRNSVLSDRDTPAPTQPLESTLATPGYVWVDAQGRPMTNADTPRASLSASGAKPAAATTTTGFVPLALSTTGKRINPGVMPQYCTIPRSTAADHFSWAPEEPVNRRYHLKKTDFSEYNEVAARFMNNLVTAKS